MSNDSYQNTERVHLGKDIAQCPSKNITSLYDLVEPRQPDDDPQFKDVYISPPPLPRDIIDEQSLQNHNTYKCRLIMLAIIAGVALTLILSLCLTIHKYDEPQDPVCGRGILSNITVSAQCICYPFYALRNNTCNYQRKSYLTAALLQTYSGFAGAGYYYIGLTFLGVAQSLLGLVTCLFIYGKSSSTAINNMLGMLVMICITAIFWIISLSLFWDNYYNDGNGYTLA